MPSSPSHSPARATSTQTTTVTACHGATTASTGAKKKPVPTYQDEPARSALMTNSSHRGMGRGSDASVMTPTVPG